MRSSRAEGGGAYEEDEDEDEDPPRDEDDEDPLPTMEILRQEERTLRVRLGSSSSRGRDGHVIQP